ncbi:MAG: ABC transporter ATP-binding protein [Anaerolineae bacterium]
MAAEFIAHKPYKTDHSSPLRYIWSHIRRHPFWGFGMVFGAFCNAALAAAVPYFGGMALNSIINGEGLPAAGKWALFILLSQLMRACLQVMRNFSAEVFAQRIERDVRDELYASLLGKSMTFHADKPVGEIMARVTNDVREMNLMMSPGMNLIIGSGMFLIVPLIAAPQLYPALLLTPSIFMIIYLYTQYRFVRTLNPIAQEVRVTFGNMNAQLAETLDGVQVVKGAASEDSEIGEFNMLADEVYRRYVQQSDIEARYLPFLWLALATVFSFIHAVYLYQQGLISIGIITAYVGQITLFQFPVYSSLRSLSQAALGYASARRILDIINTKTELDQNTEGYAQPLQGAIEFRDVTFGYGDGKEILQHLTFKIEPGQTVAIVGQTGSGKSSVIKLINRTWDTTSGEVLVDGVNVKDWNLASLRSQISIIEQDIFLFSRSIAENVAFGRKDTTRELVEDAARKAQAHDFIQTFPEGYDTVIGQRGVTLSGGQRQRVAIARAFMTNPPILILDDSTSAIDSATEDHIQRAIWAAAKGRTTILITHRLSQIRWADHIIVLRQGRVVAQGKHEDLLQTSDAYRRIFARYEGTSTEEFMALTQAEAAKRRA